MFSLASLNSNVIMWSWSHEESLFHIKTRSNSYKQCFISKGEGIVICDVENETCHYLICPSITLLFILPLLEC